MHIHFAAFCRPEQATSPAQIQEVGKDTPSLQREKLQSHMTKVVGPGGEELCAVQKCSARWVVV